MEKRKEHAMSSSEEEESRSFVETPKRKKINEKPKIAEGTSNYGFYLTKVNGISAKFNDDKMALDIKDILSHGKLLKSAQFSYVFDVEWLINQYPEKFRSLPLLIVHGEQRESKKVLENQAKPFSNISLCQAKLPITYGTHHTKMMILLYDEGLRIVIHTSNLVPQDWHQKSQGMWKSPLFRKLKPDHKPQSHKTNFKADIMQYLEAYQSPELKPWIEIIGQHDLSNTNVFLIGSIPGRHLGNRKNCFGHLKLRKVLANNIQKSTDARPLLAQFSSIGSLGSTESQWLGAEFLSSMASTANKTGLTPTSLLHLIFPTVENVRLSLEGYPAGVSIPYSYKVEQKQPYLRRYFCWWQAQKTGRTEASPHIKTYACISPDCSTIAWFLLTSANLSKAAWGSLEKKGEQLMIRSYELGVLFVPQMFGHGEFSYNETDSNFFPIPFDLPLKKYSGRDEPWTWDAPHINTPDRNGNKWCPS